MSQPTLARTFKFVGGPSRKRRRCVAPTARKAAPTSHQSNHVTKPAGQPRKKSIQPSAAAPDEVTECATQEQNDGGIAHRAASSNGEATGLLIPQETTHDNLEGPQTTVSSSTDAVLDSLLEWTASADLSMIPEGLESVLEFEDTLPLFNSPLSYLPHTSIQTAASIEPPDFAQYSSEEDSQEGTCPPLPAAVPFESFANTAGYPERERRSGLGYCVAATDYTDDKLDTLLAQCEISAVFLEFQRQIPSRTKSHMQLTYTL